MTTGLRRTFATCLLPLLVGVGAGADAAQLTAGPMPGPPGHTAVDIWLQADGPGEAALAYRPADTADTPWRQTPARTLAADADYTATLTLRGLEPGRRYRYRVLLDGEAVATDPPLTLATQQLWQWRTAPPAFTVAAGSCNYVNEPPLDRPGRPFGDKYRIYDAILSQGPQLMLWLGDNLYLREADYSHRAGMAHRYRHSRAFAPLQPLLRGTAHAAVWDDHDFGPNNSNRSFIFKDQSLRLFRRYWPNPNAGLAELPGSFTQVRLNDVAFFLLDGRFHRDAGIGPDPTARTLYGEGQLQWLRNALLASRASFKVIVGGSQFLHPAGRYEGWGRYPDEREAFLDWLAAANVPGVLFLSGDRHHSELYRHERRDDYPLYELTCSPLTAGTHRLDDMPPLAGRVEGTLVGERNFCTLAFDGPQHQRRLTLTVHDADGEPLWQQTIDQRGLR